MARTLTKRVHVPCVFVAARTEAEPGYYYLKAVPVAANVQMRTSTTRFTASWSNMQAGTDGALSSDAVHTAATTSVGPIPVDGAALRGSIVCRAACHIGRRQRVL